MPGKSPHPDFGRLALVALCLALTLLVAPWARAAEAPIAILLSDSDPTYREQADAFACEVGRACRIFNLQGDLQLDPGLKGSLLASRPALIYALGAKAAYAAKLWTKEHQEIPVLFALVLNWSRYNLLEEQDNVAGISAEVPAGTQFANMTMISPAIKRIGVIHGPHSTGLLAQIQRHAALLGVTLVTDLIQRPDEFDLAFKRLSHQVDAFWLLPDPTIYSLENLNWLESRCLKEKILCVGQSQNLAKTGMALTINPDPGQIASQASAMVHNILDRGMKPSEIKVMEPLGTQLLINLKTADEIGLPLSPQALSLATSVIR